MFIVPKGYTFFTRPKSKKKKDKKKKAEKSTSNAERGTNEGVT